LGQKKNENKSKYINLILKTNLGRDNNEYINNDNNEFLAMHYYNNSESFNYSVDEENDIKQKIVHFSEFLDNFPFNFDIINQIYELIENYFNDDVIITKKNIDLNKYKLFIQKIIYFGENIFIRYLNFLINYFMFDYSSDNDSYYKLKEILENINYIIKHSDNKNILNDNENKISMQNGIVGFYKNIIFEVLKKKILKKIKKMIFLMKKNKEKEEDVNLLKKEVGRIFEIINICKEIITGEKLIEINKQFYNYLLKKEFILYIQKLK
jgi:hypothetical protein